MDGFEVLKQLRRTSDVPVLMLTARGEEADRIVGLEIGADDYLPKTFSTRELLARLRAVTRRAARGYAAQPEAAPEIVVGRLRVNTAARTALLADQRSRSHRWSSISWRAGASTGPGEVARATAGRNPRAQLRRVRPLHRRPHLRAAPKLGDDPKEPRFIRTVRTAGYMLINPDPATT